MDFYFVLCLSAGIFIISFFFLLPDKLFGELKLSFMFLRGTRIHANGTCHLGVSIEVWINFDCVMINKFTKQISRPKLLAAAKKNSN